MSLFSKKKILYIFLLFSYFQISYNKHAFFPFKKMTIEYFNESRTIADFIDFNIYSEVKVGTPAKPIAFFIVKGNLLFSFRDIVLQGHETAEYKEIERRIVELLDIFYNSSESTSFDQIDEYYGVYSDIFYFKDITEKETSYNLEFSMISGDRGSKLCGELDVFSYADPYDEYNKYLFPVLRSHGVIDGYYITFLYGEYNLDDDTFNYFNDDYSNILGNLILGDSPHELYPDKYKKDDEIKVNGNFQFYINEIKFKCSISNYTENDKTIYFKFNSQFIKGTTNFKYEIERIFFNELINKKICRKEVIDENIYISRDEVYSCENNDEMKEKIKHFPTIYFEIKESNLTFLFNYKELFKVHHNRLYFLIIFKNNYWEFGEIFLRKYITSFNYDSHTISFYKEQVDDINKRTDIPYPDPEPEPEPEEEEKGKEEEKEEEKGKEEEKEEEKDEKKEEEKDEKKEEEKDEKKEDKEEEKEEEKRKKEGEEKKEEEKKGKEEEKGKETDKPIKPEENNSNIRLIVEIVMGVVIVIAVAIIIYLIIKFRKRRKKRVAELTDDDDYEYFHQSPEQIVN